MHCCIWPCLETQSRPLSLIEVISIAKVAEVASAVDRSEMNRSSMGERPFVWGDSSSILLALVCVLCVFYVHAWPQLCCTYSATGKGSFIVAISVLLLRDIFRAIFYFL